MEEREKQRYTASVGVLEREKERERGRQRHSRLKALLYDAQEKDKREHKAIEEEEWQRARKDS